MKKYVDSNTGMRISAKSQFEKYLYRLMNNAVFSNTIGKVDNRRDIKLITYSEFIRNSSWDVHCRSNSSLQEQSSVDIRFNILKQSNKSRVSTIFFYGFVKNKLGD